MDLLNIFITFHIVTYWQTVSTKFCSMSPICVCYFDDTYANISDRLEAITQVERREKQMANWQTKNSHLEPLQIEAIVYCNHQKTI